LLHVVVLFYKHYIYKHIESLLFGEKLSIS